MNCFCEKFDHFGKSQEEIINKKEVQVILLTKIIFN